MILADTSVWSLALRRDGDADSPLVARLGEALHEGEVATTGLIVQELFQGMRGPKQHDETLRIVSSVELLPPTFDDHLFAAGLRNDCRRNGVQLETVDALIAALCVRRDLVLLTADQDFHHVARLSDLDVWEAPAA